MRIPGGDRAVVDEGKLRGSYTVLSVWIIPTGDDTPYLVTAYVE